MRLGPRCNPDISKLCAIWWHWVAHASLELQSPELPLFSIHHLTDPTVCPELSHALLCTVLGCLHSPDCLQAL